MNFQDQLNEAFKQGRRDAIFEQRPPRLGRFRMPTQITNALRLMKARRAVRAARGEYDAKLLSKAADDIAMAKRGENPYRMRGDKYKIVSTPLDQAEMNLIRRINDLIDQLEAIAGEPLSDKQIRELFRKYGLGFLEIDGTDLITLRNKPGGGGVAGTIGFDDLP